MIDTLLNKPFEAGAGSHHYRICKYEIAEGEITYSISLVTRDGEYLDHAANVEKVTKSALHWYKYYLGKRVSGVLKFSDIKLVETNV